MFFGLEHKPRFAFVVCDTLRVKIARKDQFVFFNRRNKQEKISDHTKAISNLSWFTIFCNMKTSILGLTTAAICSLIIQCFDATIANLNLLVSH